MSLARTARALARLAAQPCGTSGGLGSLSSLRPAQQLVSLWSYTPAQGFAASAAAAQAEPAAAEPPAAAAAGLPPVYTPLGETVSERYTVPPKPVFAVVEVGGTQYKVTPDDVIVVEKLGDVDVNDKLRLQRVLLLGSAAETVIGRPYVPGAAVDAAVEVRRVTGGGRQGAGRRGRRLLAHECSWPDRREGALQQVCLAAGCMGSAVSHPQHAVHAYSSPASLPQWLDQCLHGCSSSAAAAAHLPAAFSRLPHGWSTAAPAPPPFYR